MSDDPVVFGPDELRAVLRDAAEKHRKLGVSEEAVQLFEDAADLEKEALYDVVGMLAALGQEVEAALERTEEADAGDADMWH